VVQLGCIYIEHPEQPFANQTLDDGVDLANLHQGFNRDGLHLRCARKHKLTNFVQNGLVVAQIRDVLQNK